MCLGPGCGRDFGDLVIGQMWEAGEDVAEISVGIDLSAAAAFDDGINDRAALAGTGFGLVVEPEPHCCIPAKWR
jgi:hypothetical protein